MIDHLADPRVVPNAAQPADAEHDVVTARREPPIVLSFDVEEHHRIEAAADLNLTDEVRALYGPRMESATRFLVDSLAERSIAATFFVVGQIAATHPALVQAIADAGHEVASHSWEHRRVLAMTPAEFRLDLRRSKEALEQATGRPVVGYRAPTFSIVRATAWAIDVLAEEGFAYDSSIYPVRHDRYGVPDAPREPFLARGPERSLLELPPATLKLGGMAVPIGGGGYFRLLPGPLFRAALRAARKPSNAPPTVLYFHPWEFDPEQPRLPLRALRRWRTYVGIGHTRGRLKRLLAALDPARCVRAVDLARLLKASADPLPTFSLAIPNSPQ